jgi:hypothetical protein
LIAIGTDSTPANQSYLLERDEQQIPMDQLKRVELFNGRAAMPFCFRPSRQPVPDLPTPGPCPGVVFVTLRFAVTG